MPADLGDEIMARILQRIAPDGTRLTDLAEQPREGLELDPPCAPDSSTDHPRPPPKV
jgi:hypothetical protein